MKLQIIYLALCSLCHGAYISRMANVNRMRVPTVFRPGVTVHRTWPNQRLVPAASHRVPYVVYRNAPQRSTHPYRYAMKHFGPATSGPRTVYAAPWKSTMRHQPLSPTQGYEFVRSIAAQASHDGGAIHTIPAPNLNLSEKPIVVIESENMNKLNPESIKTYEVTEKFVDQPVFQMSPKIEIPVGFSKQAAMTSPDLQSLLKNGAALQFASDYGLSIALPQAPMVPQQFAMQTFNAVPGHQELINSGVESIVIPQNALYQTDPSFMQKLQSQLMQRFPSLDFAPYTADGSTIQQQQQQQFQSQHEQIQQQQHQIQQQQQQIQQQQQQVQNPLYLLQNDEITKQTPTSFEPSKNVVQRETHESAVMSLIPQSFNAYNTTDNQIEVTSASQPQNVTVEVISPDPQPSTTTVKYIIESTTQQAQQNITPIYYAQVGQSIGNAIANGFYSAINDVRAAAALAQVEKPQDHENITSTTINPDLKAYFIQQTEGPTNNTIELKPLLGVPFSKTADSMNIAYTLLRANNKEQKLNKEGAVYAGQIVEATISEDQDFNKEKATLLTNRAPLRIISVTEKKEMPTITTVPPKITVVKAKIPPKSKLTFDDKTGEPVLRIYASYLDTPLQRQHVTTKLNNMRNIVVKKPDTVENWTSAMLKKFEKTQGYDLNQVTDFGLKLRSRSDDYIPLFEEYEE